MKLKPEPNEKVISEELSSYIPADNWFAGSMGNLAVTNQRIVYEPFWWYSVFATEVEIPLRDVILVAKSHFPCPSILVETSSKKKFRFASMAQRHLIETINRVAPELSDATTTS